MANLLPDSLLPRLREWRNRLRQPWLVAAWPGMGGVAQVAAHYLSKHLAAARIGDLPFEECFEPRSIEVHRGLVRPFQAPHNTLAAWRNPAAGPDIVLLLGDAQPEHDAQRCGKTLVTVARELGVVRVCTFAAMATMIRPEARPRVFAVASDQDLLDEARRLGAEPLASGSIGGLNGLLVALAARAGLPGLCLLGEMPYFASGIANPKASAAVLRLFCRLAGLEVDLTELDAAAVAVEQGLVERMQKAEQQSAEMATPAPKQLSEPPTAAEQRAAEDKVRIERLFDEAKLDRGKAQLLKLELDRLGVFRDYEDRFLDLFRRGE
jgi:proteasome assembly chaperone (PAC2) family protein